MMQEYVDVEYMFTQCAFVTEQYSLVLGTCEASRFDSIRRIPIRFESDGQPHLPSYHKPRSLFNKKNFNRCAVVIEIYFMFMILCLCSKNIHTR